LEQFQREKRKIIRALKHVKGDLTALEGTKYVTRGFECYQSVPFNRRIRKQRQAVVRQVLDLQSEQKQAAVTVIVNVDDDSDGMQTTASSDNSEALAEVARQESSWARGLAFQLGQKDAVEMGWKEFFSMETSMDSDSDGSDENMELNDVCISQVFHQTPVPTIVDAAAC
jgi:hypothetical protein